MNVHLDRAQMLLSQGRAEMAEKELRAALAEDPDDAVTHAMLSLCLCDLEKYDEATTEAKAAIGRRPDFDITHYALAQVMYQRNRFAESREAIQQAIQLDPWDAAYHAHLAAIEIQASNWKACLDAAEKGLEADPEHQRCINLRSMALTRLGRRVEAATTMETAMAINPENAFSHANKGWASLHESKPKEAMEHFREALRLEPNLEWARAGIVEAMKARNPIYRVILAFFLWMAGLSPRVQMGLIIGLVVGQRVLVGITSAVPALEPLRPVIIFGYLAFVWLTWVAPTLFNLVLRLDRFGRLVLSPEERFNSSIVGIYVAIGVSWIIADGVLFQFAGMWILGIPFLLALIPLNAMFSCQAPGPKWIMGGIVALVTLMAVGGIVQALVLGQTEAGGRLILNSALLCLYSTWASIFLIGWNSPKKI